jgi:pantothenate kinase
VPQLIAVDLPLHTDWYMQNEATQHRVKVVLTRRSAQAEFPTVIQIAMDVARIRHAVVMTLFSVISLWLPLNNGYSQATQHQPWN